MNVEDYLQSAIELVSAWDLPDDEFATAVNALAHLMAGCCPDGSWEESLLL